jgi:hypothetical protein
MGGYDIENGAPLTAKIHLWPRHNQMYANKNNTKAQFFNDEYNMVLVLKDSTKAIMSQVLL